MNLTLWIILWIVGSLAGLFLFMLMVISAISEKRSDKSKREHTIIMSISSILLIILLSMAAVSLFNQDKVRVASTPSQTSSLSSETTTAPTDITKGEQRQGILIWVFYFFFFGYFFIWLFLPSKKEDAAKDDIKKDILHRLMLNKMNNSSKH